MDNRPIPYKFTMPLKIGPRRALNSASGRVHLIHLPPLLLHAHETEKYTKNITKKSLMGIKKMN